MLEQEIEKKSFDLISKLETKPFVHDNNDDFEKIKGVSKILTIDQVLTYKTNKTDVQGNKVDAYIQIGSELLGLSFHNYKALKDIAFYAIEEGLINEKADYSFIEERIFDWLIDVHQNKKIGQSLLHYLQDCVDVESKAFVFYFKIISLGIETAFTIDDVEILYMDEYLINSFIKAKSQEHKEELTDFFKHYKNSIVAKVKAEGVKKKAQKIAANKVSLALDCLKIFYITTSLDIGNQIFDVDFRFSQKNFCSVIYAADEKDLEFEESMFRVGGSAPIIISTKEIEQFNKAGLKVLSNFVSKDHSDELYIEIINGIEKLGDITSTRNMYERIVRLVSFFEGFLIPKTNTKSMGESYLKNNVVDKLKSLKISKEDYKLVIRKSYQIRDKYLHNRIELPIDFQDLAYFQNLAVTFLSELIKFNENNKTLESLYDYYGIKSK